MESKTCPKTSSKVLISRSSRIFTPVSSSYRALADNDKEILRVTGITGEDTAYTESAHIIPFGLASFNDSNVLLPYLMLLEYLLMLTSTTTNDLNMGRHGGPSLGFSPS